MTPENEIAFNTGVISPIACYKEGFALIKEKYFLFLGICVAGVLLASFGPMGLLLGPMMCGIYGCLLAHMRGEEVGFDALMKGFEVFLPSWIVALIQIVPLMLISIPLTILSLAPVFYQIVTEAPHSHGEFNPMISSAFFITFAIHMVVLMIASAVVHALFMFAYPLVMERKLEGLAAVKLSLRAARANLTGVFGIALLGLLLGLGGMLLCYVGAILVLPLQYAAWAVAYRKVFPVQS
jgi:hypothetical protein